jgi:hypothetical protein
MAILEILIFCVSLPLFGLAFALMLVVGYEQARRKGYRALGAALTILAGSTVSVVVAILRSPPNSTNYRFFVDFFWLPLLFAAVATAIVILVLPRRTGRVFGQRRVKFPLVWVGQAIIAFGLLLSAVTVHLWLAGQRDSTFVLKVLGLGVGFLIPTGRFVIRRGRRLEGAPSFEQHLVQDARPPVLYLRAFQQERQFFVIGASSGYGAYGKSWHASVSRSEQNVGISFEQFVSGAVESRLGPFVALGSPEDYLAPEGAFRLYAKDKDWMEKADGLARESVCILVEIGESANLRWEFEHLRREGLQQKLFVITRHSTEGAWVAWAFWDLVWRLQGLRPLNWRRFSKDLARLDYHLDFKDPGPGSVVTFDAEGRGIVLTTGADQPADFVEPIRAWTVAKRKIGRHVPRSCSRCGRGFYTSPEGAEAGEEWCRNCKAGSARQGVWVKMAPTACVFLVLLLLLAFIGAAAVWIPEESFMGRHIGGIVTAVFISLMVILITVVGRLGTAAGTTAEVTKPRAGDRGDDDAAKHHPADRP